MNFLNWRIIGETKQLVYTPAHNVYIWNISYFGGQIKNPVVNFIGITQGKTVKSLSLVPSNVELMFLYKVINLTFSFSLNMILLVCIYSSSPTPLFFFPNLSLHTFAYTVTYVSFSVRFLPAKKTFQSHDEIHITPPIDFLLALTWLLHCYKTQKNSKASIVLVKYFVFSSNGENYLLSQLLFFTYSIYCYYYT